MDFYSVASSRPFTHGQISWYTGPPRLRYPFFVATASYRLLPEITIVKPCEAELAEKLASCFPKGVIKVENQKG